MTDHVDLPSGGMLFEWSRAPRALTVVGRILVVALVLAGAFLFAPWQQVAPAAGRVVAYSPAQRPQVVEAPLDGRVVKVFVQEGQRVAAGDPLLDVTDVDPALVGRLHAERDALTQREMAARSRVDSDSARAESLELALRAAVDGARSRVLMAQERRTAAGHALEAAQAALSTAELNLKRQNALLADGLVSRRAMEVAQLEFTRARTELERTQAAARASHNEVESLEADAQRVQREAAAAASGARANAASARGEVASTRAEQSRLGVRISRQESQRVVASHDGQVLRVMTSQGGEMVKAGDPLILLVPETRDRAVEVFVNGLDAPLLREGQDVRIQFEGWPAVQFSGWPNLAVGTFAGRVAFVDSTDDGKGRFRALVTPAQDAPPWPTPEQLRQGVRAQGFILLNQVTVGFELWRQVNGFPPLPTNPPKTPEKK